MCRISKYAAETIMSALFFIFVASLVGCSHGPTYKIGVSQCSDDDWRQKMNDEIRREMMFHPEAVVEIRSADDSSEKQISDINYFLDNKFDIIIAAPNEARSLTPVIEKAYKQGVPVILFDRNIDGDSYTAWQGADNIGIGRMAADYVVRKFGAGLSVLEIYGLQGSTPADERHEGFAQTKGVNIVATGFGNWNYDDAYRVADSLLSLHPEVEVVYAHNDRMAIAAADASRRRGLSPFIMGIDAAPQIGLKAVADSTINATFVYPTDGQQLIKTAIAILEGTPYERFRRIKALPAVDASNVDIVISQNEAIRNETARMEMLKKEVDDYWSQHTSQTAVFYAVIAIVILLFGVIFLLLRAFWEHKRHRESLIRQNRLLQEERDKQKILNEQLDEATKSKLIFFTNVSHDLRTPLTLIAEPIEQMVASPGISQGERNLMRIAQKNVSLLKRLINHILDLRKLENRQLVLRRQEVSLAALVSEWVEAFSALAVRRNLRLDLRIEAADDESMAVDVGKMESVFYNIMGNAFKFTPDGGEICISFVSDGREARLEIKDSGKGIPADALPFIFDRFFSSERVHSTGSGIGLAVAKAFVEMHGGKISVESAPDKGTVFTIVLPVEHVEENYDASARPALITEATVNMELGDPQLSGSEADYEENAQHDAERLRVLAIDDNPDIRILLKELLGNKYTVIEAQDGAEGIELAEKYVPDLIICDMMMPGMDGLECVRRLKENQLTSHIPVLMLTACAMDEQRIEGYGVGADGYISKPFNTSVLTARIRNLIEGRKRLYWHFNVLHPETTADTSETAADPRDQTEKRGSGSLLSDIDSEFYRKFLAVVRRDMGNPDMSVETIASELGIAYGQLYRKIKALTNFKPVELLRLIRLETSREQLLNTEKTVSEISYDVGFSTPAYFTKCYRDQYGETPTETRERNSAS